MASVCITSPYMCFMLSATIIDYFLPFPPPYLAYIHIVLFDVINVWGFFPSRSSPGPCVGRPAST